MVRDCLPTAAVPPSALPVYDVSPFYLPLPPCVLISPFSPFNPVPSHPIPSFHAIRTPPAPPPVLVYSTNVRTCSLVYMIGDHAAEHQHHALELGGSKAGGGVRAGGQEGGEPEGRGVREGLVAASQGPSVRPSVCRGHENKTDLIRKCSVVHGWVWTYRQQDFGRPCRVRRGEV